MHYVATFIVTKSNMIDTSDNNVDESSGFKKSKSRDDTKPTNLPCVLPSSVMGIPENPHFCFTCFNVNSKVMANTTQI